MKYNMSKLNIYIYILLLFPVCHFNAFAKTNNDKYIEILKQIPKTDLHAHFTATVPEKNVANQTIKK